MKTFWVDRDRDRYLTAVRDRAAEFAATVGDIAPVAFACVAWTVAVPPALDPGYVRWHRRVLTAQCLRNPFDGGLTARVELVSPLPAQLTASRTWWRDRGWRGWPELFGQFVQPSAQDLARHPHLRGTLLLETPLPLDGLPTPTQDRHVDAAADRAVAVLVRHLDDVVRPVVAQLDADHAAR
ncbi:hypothetical protein AB0H83_39630 [Dactylosporangium sp. NPDC050688]|uniref:hypothetical protein n=1 Tax=Dactylosporangium sp. NPDC050688 TaxID=3157217 RepID=UPI003411955C